MRKIYTVGGGAEYSCWMEGITATKMQDADLVVFTGGEDINPELYNRKPHFSTHFNSYRDQYEVDAFNQARSLGKKMIGICRGAQLFCALSGGILVQDSRHPYIHEMQIAKGRMMVTSAHHQRQYPWVSTKDKSVNFKLLGWSNLLSPFSFGESDKDKLPIQPEVEIALYPDIDALAIQSHPEWAYPARLKWQVKYINFCRNLLNEFMESDYQQEAA